MYPASGSTSGGYVLYLKFDQEGYVTAANEIIPQGGTEETTYQSLYALRNDKGAVLSFSLQ